MARVVFALLVLLAVAPPAQAQGDSYAMQLLRDWIDAVHAHMPGMFDDAATSIAAWNREDQLRLHPYVLTLVGLVPDPARPERKRARVDAKAAVEVGLRATLALRDLSANDFVKRAALLHTDIVLLHQQFPATVAPPKPRSRQSLIEREEAIPLVIARGPDGRFSGFEFGNLHWDYARDLLDNVTPSPAADETVALWYRAVSATFASQYNFGEAWPHIVQARRLLPNDPGILYGDAAIQETLASPRIQDYVRTTQLPNEGRFLFVESSRQHLEKAEELLKRALKADANFVEARLRLGRVSSQLGRHKEALTELTAVLVAQPDPVVTFYAHLLTGDALRALTRNDEARDSYQRALNLFPNAQSARMALGHLARLRSDREDALAMLRPTLDKPALGRDQDDPWWDYHRGDGRIVDDLLRRLRRPFLPKEAQ